MSVLLWNIDPNGGGLGLTTTASPEGKAQLEKYFKNWDIHGL